MVVLVCLAAACEPPAREPTSVESWRPGDAPLRFWAENDVAWSVTKTGCDRWAVISLQCERSDRASADVHVGVLDIGSIARAWIGDDGMSHLDYDKASLGWPSGAHEIGHLLGMWGHIDDQSALMYFATGSEVPTSLDLDQLERVWGEAPWETDGDHTIPSA